MSKKTDIEGYFKKSGGKVSGRKKIGWFCTYAPEELIMAGGFDPIRLMGEKKLKTSESYFPINFCPYLKSGWESLMGAGEELSAVIFTNSCDGMRRFYDIAEHYLKDIPTFMLDVPRNADKNSIDFFSLKLKECLQFIEKTRGGKIDTREILDAIEFYNNKRKELKNMSRSFFNSNGSLDVSGYYNLMELSATEAPAQFLGEIKAFNQRSKEDTRKQDDNKPRIMVIGNFITEEKLWDMFSELDMDIVCDDLCISNRYYEKNIEVDGSAGRKELLRLIAKRYLEKPACMRMADTAKKLKDIKLRVKDNDVQGVVFISLKFCDTMLYSFPLIRKEMADLKVPVLYLEIEYNNFSEGQVKTRMQAFLEMI